jgi:hypothetical protein
MTQQNADSTNIYGATHEHNKSMHGTKLTSYAISFNLCFLMVIIIIIIIV